MRYHYAIMRKQNGTTEESLILVSAHVQMAMVSMLALVYVRFWMEIWFIRESFSQVACWNIDGFTCVGQIEFMIMRKLNLSKGTATAFAD